jgi:hypothetical protein
VHLRRAAGYGAAGRVGAAPGDGGDERDEPADVSADTVRRCSRIRGGGPGTKAWKPTASDPFGLGSTVNILYERLAKDIDSQRTVQAASVSYGADNVRTLTHDYPKYFRDLSTGVGWVLGYLKTLAAVCPDQRIVLVGYSQGAMVMHRVLHNLGTSGAGKQILKRVVSAVLVGDEPAEMGDPHPAPGALRFGHMPHPPVPGILDWHEHKGRIGLAVRDTHGRLDQMRRIRLDIRLGIFSAALGSAVIVVGVEPVWQGAAAFVFGPVGLGVGPFVGQGAVEPLHFAVGLGPVGPGSPRGDAELVARERPQFRAVAGAVVADDALDGDAVAGVPGVRAVQERGCGVFALVGQDLCVGEPGVVVQGGVQVAVAQDRVSVASAPCGGCGGLPVTPAGLLTVDAGSTPSGMLPSFLTSTWISSPGRSRS